MAELKTSYVITFADRASAIVYTEEIARNIVSGRYDPASFAPGTVTGVFREVTEWSGSHDDGTRSMRLISSESMDLAALRD